MSLRDLCRSVAQRARSRLDLTPFGVPATLRVAEKIGAQGEATLEPPASGNLDEIRRRIERALAAGETVDARDLRHAPWCIFAPDAPFSTNAQLLQDLLEQIAARARRPIFRSLAAAYLYFFDPDSRAVQIVGRFLAQRIVKLGAPWTRAEAEIGLFSSVSAPGLVAETALASDHTPDQVFADLGVADPGALAGFGKHAVFRGLEEIAARSNAAPLERLARVRDWSTLRGRLRYDEARSRVANALLLPFGDTIPDDEAQQEYLAFLLPLMGDPRTAPGRWTGCEKAQDILRRWLTKVALRQFFEVVDRVAPPEHWSYRRAFWSALYDRHYISDAWVVFESHGARTARAMFGKDISFATFDGGGVQTGHSALLLRIGSLIVAEWSNNGKCSIWNQARGEDGPAMFRKGYKAAELRKEIISGRPGQRKAPEQGVFLHHGSPEYRWQGEIRDYLGRNVNIYLRPSEYELRS